MDCIMKLNTTCSLLIYSIVNMIITTMRPQVYKNGNCSGKTSQINNQSNTNHLQLIPNQSNLNYDIQTNQFQYIMSILNQMSHQTDEDLQQLQTSSQQSRGNELNQKINEQFFIEDDSTDKMAKKIMKEIQQLNYNDQNSQEQFKKKVNEHIVFKQLIPQKSSIVGERLIQDGLFHQMWKKASQRNYQQQLYGNYYQQFYSIIAKNISDFQNAFNQCNSQEEEVVVVKQLEEDSNTRLTEPKTAIKLKSKIVQNSILQSSKENQQLHYSIEQQPSNRLRLINEIQTNKRRLNAQIVCYFLGIKKSFHLAQMQIDKVLQFYHDQDKQVLILQAHQPGFCQIVNKMVIDYQPKIYMAMYGFVNLGMLMRIKQQYHPIEGFILYEELLNLPLWLKNNGFMQSQQ